MVSRGKIPTDEVLLEPDRLWSSKKAPWPLNGIFGLKVLDKFKVKVLPKGIQQSQKKRKGVEDHREEEVNSYVNAKEHKV